MGTQPRRHPPRIFSLSNSSSAMLRSCTVNLRCRPSVISESRVIPGRIAPSYQRRK